MRIAGRVAATIYTKCIDYFFLFLLLGFLSVSVLTASEELLFFAKPKIATIGAKIIHQNLAKNGRNFANIPILAKAFTPKLPATKPPIPMAAILSPDL